MTEEISPTPLDRHFAALLARLNGAPDAVLERVALAASAWRAAGHTCVPLSELEGNGLAEKMRASAMVGAPGDFKPLILDDAGRIYLQRYWQYESGLAEAIRTRLTDAACDEALLARGLKRLFPGAEKADRQRASAEVAVRKSFAIITGGPGTGKTYTAARVLALLSEQFAARGKTPRLALAAPTGKAAARLQESISRALAEMPPSETLHRLKPPEARTIHRLLGTLPDSPSFRHDRARPLEIDALLVDEASMVDVALMAKLLDAVPPAARVILIGDRDQLASVEAGNVLGDICGSGATTTNAPIAAHIVELRAAHRFQQDSGIRQLSSLVNAGEVEGALGLLRAGTFADVCAQPTPSPRALESALAESVVEPFRSLLECAKPADALAKLNEFRILAATRRGPHGSENLNILVEQALAAAGLIDPKSAHYHGRPVLIGANDYQLRLFNGDMGLILRDPLAAGDLRAFFLDATGSLRRVLPARLPAHETGFAMTVHKSQGSEFGKVLLILPDRDTLVATREMIYTAITRARSAVEIWSNDEPLAAAIARRTTRTSGLRDALWVERRPRGRATSQ